MACSGTALLLFLIALVNVVSTVIKVQWSKVNLYRDRRLVYKEGVVFCDAANKEKRRSFTTPTYVYVTCYIMQ
jgi:hypothetical protein